MPRCDTTRLHEQPKRKSLQFNLRSLLFLTTAAGGALLGWRQSPSLRTAIVWEILFVGLVAWIAFRLRTRASVAKTSE
jgi:hypothetical protein